MRTLRRGVALAVAMGAAAALGGCGTPSPDLFVVNRTGTVPGAKLAMLVSDTSVRCNLGPRRELSSAQTIKARDIARDLNNLIDDHKAPPPGPGQIFSFNVRSEEGTVRFGDTTTNTVFARIELFTRTVARGVCGLTR